MEVIILGAGIGGLTLGLALQKRGVPCRIFEAAPEIRAIGAGVNLLPHSTRELAELGLEDELARVAVTTKEAAFFNRFGQFVYSEPVGRYAGYDWPQFSIHRGDLQSVLLDAFKERAGADRVQTGWTFVSAEQDAQGARAYFKDSVTGEALEPQAADAIISCEGIHSALRKQLYPNEGDPIYSGYNMWRGVTPMPPFLTGASMTRIGWLSSGKLVVYPIRNQIDDQGRQLINWVAELETPNYRKRDWNRPGKLEDFIHIFENWTFDWLDVPALIRGAEQVLEFPMVDLEPLDQWSFGRLTLLGDAAHPMYPRGSNGAGQAILDARSLADSLASHDDPVQALRAYEVHRIEATAKVVRMNRENPPDAILREVCERTGDQPFERIEDVIGSDELRDMQERYKQVAGYDRRSLASTDPQAASSRPI